MISSVHESWFKNGEKTNILCLVLCVVPCFRMESKACKNHRIISSLAHSILIVTMIVLPKIVTLLALCNNIQKYKYNFAKVISDNFAKIIVIFLVEYAEFCLLQNCVIRNLFALSQVIILISLINRDCDNF